MDTFDGAWVCWLIDKKHQEGMECWGVIC